MPPAVAVALWITRSRTGGAGRLSGELMVIWGSVVMKGTMEGMVDFMSSHPTVGAMSCRITYPPAQTETLGTDGETQTLPLQWFPSPLTLVFRLLFLSDKAIE